MIVGAAMLAAGLIFASPVLVAPGAALVLLVLGTAAWALLAGRGSGVHRVGLPARVVEAEPFEVRHRVRRGAIHLRADLLDPVLPGPRRVSAEWPRRFVDVVGEATLEGRGRRVVPEPVLRIGDPLGIWERRVGGGGETGLVVLPRVEQIRLARGGGGTAAGLLPGIGGERSGRGLPNAPADPELDGLRPYGPGLPASRIYWPGLARNGELLARRLAGAGGTAPLVALDSEGQAPAEVDRAVRAAASICRRLAEVGACELLLPGGERLSVDRRPGSWEEAHVALALAGHGVPRLGEAAPDATLFWVSAGAAEALPRRMSGFLVTAAPLPGRAVVFEVAGCRGYALAGAARTGAGRRAAA